MARLDEPTNPDQTLEEILDEEAGQMMKEPASAPPAPAPAVSESFTGEADVEEKELPADMRPIVQALNDLEHHGYALFVLHRKEGVVGSYRVSPSVLSDRQVRDFQAEASVYFARLVQLGVTTEEER